MSREPVPGWTRSAEHAPRVLRVAELNRVARFALEERFPDVWVEGELADVSRPASGHVYFTLCDADAPAQVRGVMYRNDANRARARLENGARVRLRCSVSIYEARGSFQVTARVALPAGEGDRAAEVARIKAKLQAEGLLDPARKRKLPRLPRVVGVVTSRDGAAIHDVIRVASARMGVRIVLVHCQVQGPDAPLSIVRAMRGVSRVPDLDVVIVARGGGASEDLSAFDDERVARAVAECRVPTVSGVGHELDVTIVDLVADVRAATPSNAAEIVVPDAAQLRAELQGIERALARALDQRVQGERLRIERLMRRIADPRRRVAAPRQALAAMHASLERVTARRLGDAHRALDRLRARLAVHEPRARLGRDRDRLLALEERLGRAMGARAADARRGLDVEERLGRALRARLEESRRGLDVEERLGRALRARLADARRELAGTDRALRALGPEVARRGRSELARLAGTLDALSPLGILARGYAIAIHAPTGRALVRAADAAVGDRVGLRVHEGSLDVVVERVRGDGGEGDGG